MSADRINDGGPAFPIPAVYDHGRSEVNSSSAYTAEGGMTLRDYFATKAMQAFAQGASGMGDFTRAEVEREFGRLADFAYLMADAMLKARGAA